MYEYMSERLDINIKWFSSKVNADDLMKLDGLINQRASEGWELVTYNYAANSVQIRGFFVVTFKRKI